MELCMRGNAMHLSKNSCQFSFKITEQATRISFEKPQFTCETHNVCQGYTLLAYSAFLWSVLKIVLGIVLSNSFTLRLYLVEGNYMPGTNPLCEFVRHDFYPMDPFE